MQAIEVIGRTPNSSYFSQSDWRGRAVTRCGTTDYECVYGKGWMQQRAFLSPDPSLCFGFIFYLLDLSLGNFIYAGKV